MKLIDKMNYDEDMSWCKPYVSTDGKVWAIECNGKIETIKNGDEIVDHPTEEYIAKVARQINEDFDYYRGYSAEYILMDAMKKCGCWQCPFKIDCDAVNTIED